MAKTIQQLQQWIASRSRRATLKLALVTALCVTGALTLGVIVYAVRLRLAGTATEPTVAAALNLRQVLAQQLHVHPASVQIARVEEKTWPDACLGAPHADDMCAQVQTPGYRITLAISGDLYTYHSDLDGNQNRLVGAPEPTIGEPLLTWFGPDDSGCQTVEVGAEGVAFGRCGGMLMAVPFSFDTRQADLAEFSAKYASFQAETPVGTVDFAGSGPTVATPDEERMIAEWARLVYLEALSGRSGASWGLALAWHREGGLTNLCGDVTIYVTGDVYATSCQGDQTTDLGHIRLDADQLALLFGWMDALQPFEWQQPRPDTTDALVDRLVFFGKGQEPIQDPGPDRGLILDFAQSLYNEVRMAVSDAPSVCLTPGAGQQLLLSEEDGYCLLYPAQYSLLQFASHRWELVIGSVLNHMEPRLSIGVEEAAGRTLADVATQLEADYAPPGFETTRSELTVDGVEAIMLDNLPGQDLNRRVAFVRDDRLYSLFFSPLGDQGTEVRRQAEALCRQVLDSFRFLDTAVRTSQPAAPQRSPLPVGLIYRADGALWVIGDDGEPRLLTRYDSALPSPDLKQVVYYDGATLWTIDPNTHAQQEIATDRIVVHLFAWVDADTVLLGTRDRSEALEGGHGFGYLTALEISTGELQVLDPENLCASLPAVSPDGQTIAYPTYGGPRLYRWHGAAQPFDPTQFSQLSDLGDFSLTSPAWSPDGQKLAWIVLGKFVSTDDAHAAILIFDLSARTVQMLHPFLPLRYGGLIAAPIWSPDGRWLALVVIAHEGVGAGTWLVAADGSREVLLTENVMTNPFWTDDGQLVWNDSGAWLLNPGTWTRDIIAPPGSGYAVGWARP